MSEFPCVGCGAEDWDGEGHSPGCSITKTADIQERIVNYLDMGGFFNPAASPVSAVPPTPEWWFCHTCSQRVPDLQAVGNHTKQGHAVYAYQSPSAESELLAIRERLQCLPDAKILEVLQSLLDDRDVAWQRVNAVTKELHQAQAENRELGATEACGWLLIETWRNKSVHHEGIALSHAAKDSFMRGDYEHGHSRSALPLKIWPLPALPPSPPVSARWGSGASASVSLPHRKDG